MPSRVLLYLLAALWAGSAWSQEVSSSGHQRSDSPADARFEIVQSPLVARGTFKLDKYTGTVSVLIQTQAGRFGWQVMHRAEHPLDKTIPGKVNYQIFSSALTAKATFLVNVNTGASWVLTEDRKQELWWDAVP